MGLWVWLGLGLGLSRGLGLRLCFGMRLDSGLINQLRTVIRRERSPDGIRPLLRPHLLEWDVHVEELSCSAGVLIAVEGERVPTALYW
jgi:hypothetical protein